MEHDFKVNPDLTAISLAYANQDYIADKILPRVSVLTESFKYREYPKDQFYTLPETRIGELGEPNTISLKSELKDGSVEAHALKDPISYSSIEAHEKAGQGDKPVQNSTIYLTNMLALSREVRTAKILQDAENYGGKIVLSGSDKFSDSNSNIIDTVQNGIDACHIAPNYAVCNNKVASKMRRHPQIVKAFHGNSGDSGIVPLSFIAELFGFKEIYVGSAQINSSKKGQVASLTGAWGDDFSMMYINPLASVDFDITFGVTAQYKERTIWEYDNPDIGTQGAKILKGVEQVKELILAPECGYIIKSAI